METIISHTEIVNAPLTKVWEHLLFKINHPQYFVPNVSEVEILEKSTEFTIRKMTVKMPNQEMTIIEKITSKNYQVNFEIIQHPIFSGYVNNIAEPINENSTKLTYTMCWLNTSNQTPANNMEVLKGAVIKSKEYIEQSA